MSNIKWSLDDITYYPLEGRYLYGSRPKSVEESTIRLTASSGKTYSYNRYTKQSKDLMFMLLEGELQSHRDLYDGALGGQPFYLSMNGSGNDAVRMELREFGFDPQERSEPSQGFPIYDLVWKLVEHVV